MSSDHDQKAFLHIMGRAFPVERLDPVDSTEVKQEEPTYSSHTLNIMAAAFGGVVAGFVAGAVFALVWVYFGG